MQCKDIGGVIKLMSEEEVVDVFHSLPDRPVLHERAESFCYDRLVCRSIGIDYNDIRDVDYYRAYIFAYRLESTKDGK